MNICKIWKNSIKRYYLEKKIFIVTEIWKILLIQITRTHKIVCENFETKNLGQYYDLYVQIDALFLADVFEKFRDMCHKIYELDPTHFYAASGLVWQVSLKKDKSKTRSFN